MGPPRPHMLARQAESLEGGSAGELMWLRRAEAQLGAREDGGQLSAFFL